MGHPTIWPAGGLLGAVVFAAVLIAAWAAFAVRIRQLVRLMLLGRPENRFDSLGERIKYFVLMVLGQRGVLRDPLPGIAHFFTFWGFIIIQLDALNLWAQGFNLTLPIISSRIFAMDSLSSVVSSIGKGKSKVKSVSPEMPAPLQAVPAEPNVWRQ